MRPGLFRLVNGEVAFVVGIVRRLRAQLGHDLQGCIGVADGFGEISSQSLSPCEVEIRDGEVVSNHAVLGFFLQRPPRKINRPDPGFHRSFAVALVDKQFADHCLGQPNGALRTKVVGARLCDFLAQDERLFESFEPTGVVAQGGFRFAQHSKEAGPGLLIGRVGRIRSLQVAHDGEGFIKQPQRLCRLAIESRDRPIIDQHNRQLVF